MKHKKTLVAILLCIVLIFGLFALVACGETDGGNNPANNGDEDTGFEYTNAIFDGYSAEEISNFENIAGKALEYIATNYSYSNTEIAFVGKDIFEDTYGKGFMGYIMVETDINSFTINIFDSEESATSSLDKEYLEYVVDPTLYGSMVIEESRDTNINIEEILLYSSKLTFFSDSEKAFINKSAKTFLNSEATYELIYAVLERYNEYEYTDEDETAMTLTANSFSWQIWPTREVYLCESQSFNELGTGWKIDELIAELDEGLGWDEDSYLKLENGTYYGYLKENVCDEN